VRENVIFLFGHQPVGSVTKQLHFCEGVIGDEVGGVVGGSLATAVASTGIVMIILH
jgi:hypothetical protein